MVEFSIFSVTAMMFHSQNMVQIHNKTLNSITRCSYFVSDRCEGSIFSKHNCWTTWKKNTFYS